MILSLIDNFKSEHEVHLNEIFTLHCMMITYHDTEKKLIQEALFHWKDKLRRVTASDDINHNVVLEIDRPLKSPRVVVDDDSWLVDSLLFSFHIPYTTCTNRYYFRCKDIQDILPDSTHMSVIVASGLVFRIKSGNKTIVDFSVREQ
jgi:hypothetical protein